MNNSEAYYRSILEAAADAILVVDEYGTIHSVNSATTRIFGYAEHELIGENVNKLMPEPYKSNHDSYIEQYLATGKARIIGYGREVIATHKDGKTIPIQLAVSEVQVEGNRMFTGIISDLSGLKQVEHALRKEYDLMNEIMNSANALMVVLDAHLRVVRFNKACEDLTGYRFDELKGEPILSLLPPDQVNDVQQSFSELNAGNRTNQFESHWLSQNGTKHLISWSNGVVLSGSGTPNYIVAIGVDVTEQRQTQAQVRDSETQFRALVENAADAFFLHDNTGRILDVNQKACDNLGYRRDELLRMNISDFETTISADELRKNLQKLSPGDTFSIEGKHRQKHGTIMDVEVNVSVVKRDGVVIFLALARDISQRKQAEQQLIEAKQRAEEANRAKSVFLSSMSHELRTPLNAILGFSQILESSSLPEDSIELVAEVKTAGNHLLALINDILDLAKIEAGYISLCQEQVNLSDLINECFMMLHPRAQGRSITQHYMDAEHNNLCIQADATRFRQVMLNLLSNAVKYNRDNGTVTVGWAPLANNRMCVFVQDQGSGIPAEKQRQLFSPFNRLGREASNIEGTGIGLVISKRLIELMHGEIGFYSTADEGTTFWVVLPQQMA